MKHAMLIVGDDLLINSPYMDYIFKSYKEYFGEIGSIKFQSKNSELLFVVESLTSEFESICIFCSNESFATMGKILATLSGDTLELGENETLITKGAIASKNGSFLINLNGVFINLINATPTQKLSEILIPFNKENVYFSLLDIDKDSAKILLDPLIKPYKITLTFSEIAPKWLLIKAKKDDKLSQMDTFLQGVKNLFSQKMIYGRDQVEFIAKILMKNGLKITFAESCTAGLCAFKFTKYSGASACLDGSLITYSNDIKHEWLGVENYVLDTQGAVSEECVRQMLEGALNASKADFSLAISGIAGPSGGSDEKPVGTVFVGAMNKSKKSVIKRLQLDGNREYIREQSAMSAYACLLRLEPELFFTE
ncbi:competence protein [Campylobacter mucosalis]|uniref:CinA family protein n=1 Tax=Campylobacter mucosalis TaxID=202 RepID=UPI0004D3A049|nr:CinA family protein [Campylobacter mucosalis]KEA46184.1 competence protein [Campylobacter mucosalis]QKF62635.1 NMN amidohydrolase [Campylobacter mucosalis]